MNKNSMNWQDFQQFGNLELYAKQLVEGFITGLHKSPFHGFSVEFAEHRAFNSGESTRHIDWKVLAKTDKLFVKRYEEETNLRCHLVLDVSGSMYYPEETRAKLMFSLVSAGSLAFLLFKQRDAVGLTSFFNGDLDFKPAKATGAQLHSIFSTLESILRSTPPSTQESQTCIPALHDLAERLPKRSFVVLFTDLFDDPEATESIFEALQHLRHKQHEVLLFHVTDVSTEKEFTWENRPYTLLDAETGEKLNIRPAEYQEDYRNYMDQFYQDIKIRCGQMKIDFIPVDCQSDIQSVMLSFFLRRNKRSGR